MTRRLSICYAAPGHKLIEEAGSTRNILAVAEALSHHVDLTLAFQSFGNSFSSDRFKITAIDPAAGPSSDSRDDVAARGLNPFQHISYLHTLDKFATRTANQFDLVLEKGWRLSGYLCRAYQAQGTPAALIENDTRPWADPIAGPRDLARYLLHLLATTTAGRLSRQVPLIIAETEQLKTALIEQRRICTERIRVVPLGVDHDLFRPAPQRATRQALGIDAEAFVMLYVGGMDRYHDLSPLLRALATTRVPGLEVHLVGDGTHRTYYEDLAGKIPQAVRFHGVVGHRLVPDFIAAADLCLAPYDTSAFPRGQVGFSTLKIPEYMACARAVASVPSGSILTQINEGRTGFLLENEVEAWQRFLADPPSRDCLAEMGRAARECVSHLSWERTARSYFDLVNTFVELE